MPKIIKICFISITLLFLHACAYNVTPYASTAQNYKALNKIPQQRKVSVGAFTTYPEGKDALTCRAAGSIKTPTEKPYHEFIRDSLIQELQSAGLYNGSSEVKIIGHLTKINFSSHSDANWDIEMDFTVNGKKITVHTNHQFESAFIADAACTRVAAALTPAVQDLLNKLFNQPAFMEALR
jgi:hypothetical protein